MHVVADLRIELDSVEAARRVRDAIDVDSEGMVAVSVEGRTLHAEASGPPATVWRTMDDLLACVSVALGVEEKTDAMDETAKYE